MKEKKKSIKKTAALILTTLLIGVVLSEDSLPYFSYSNLLQRIKLLNSDTHNLIQVTWGERIYSGIPTLQCYSTDQCRYPIIKLTNFNKPSSKIKSLPHSVVVAGLDGMDRIGPSAVIHYLEHIIKNKDKYRTIFNEMVLVFLPLANPFGYLQKVRFENGVDVSSDFPFNAINKNCFISSSSRFVNEVFRHEMFVSALFFNVNKNDDNAISKAKNDND